jgi:hypothetical protein
LAGRHIRGEERLGRLLLGRVKIPKFDDRRGGLQLEKNGIIYGKINEPAAISTLVGLT